MKSIRCRFTVHRVLPRLIAFTCLCVGAYGFSIESPNKHHAPGEARYSLSANGLQLHCFEDGINALNYYLNNRIQGEYEIELRPAPSEVRSLVEQDLIPCTWSLAVNYLDFMGGIKKDLCAERVVTIYVDDNICPADLQIPSGTKVVSTEQLKERYRAALSHPNANVRSLAMNLLVSADPYDTQSALRIAQRLDNFYDYDAAAMNLSRFAKHVEGPLEALRVTQKKIGKRPVIENAIKKIKAAPNTRREEKIFRNRYDLISEFVSTRNLAMAAASNNVN